MKVEGLVNNFSDDEFEFLNITVFLFFLNSTVGREERSDPPYDPSGALCTG